VFPDRFQKNYFAKTNEVSALLVYPYPSAKDIIARCSGKRDFITVFFHYTLTGIVV
jgi:hypothetical protein